MDKTGPLYDQPNSFGWISIALHWTTAVAVIALWFLGQSIELQSAEELDARRGLHVTLGLLLWLPLAGRIAWRLRVNHPRAVGQSDGIHKLARYAHNFMLLILAVMLISGPLMALILPAQSELNRLVFAVHSSTAILFAILVVLHILAAMKHLMFHDDETIARIFVPRKTKEKEIEQVR